MNISSEELETALKAFENNEIISAYDPDWRLKKILKDIKSVAALKANWNGYEVLAPKQHSIKKSREWITQFWKEYRVFYPPHVAPNEEGIVVFEWMGRKKKFFSLYFELDKISFIKGWGTNIENEMTDGIINSNQDVIDLLKWWHKEDEE